MQQQPFIHHGPIPKVDLAELERHEQQLRREIELIKRHTAGIARHPDPQTARELDEAIAAGYTITLPDL